MSVTNYMIGVVVLISAAIQVAIDVRLFGWAALVPVAVVLAIVVMGILLILAGLSISHENRGRCSAILNRPYWLILGISILYLISCDITGIIGSVSSDLRVVTGHQYLRMATIVIVVVVRYGLRPAKTW
jgi:hypothetical protein